MKVNILAIFLLLLLCGCDSLSTDQSCPEPDPFKPQLLEKEPWPDNLDEIRQSIGYPAMAKEAEIEGTVELRILIDEEGNYVRHVALKEGHPALLKAVAREIQRLQCDPAIQAGKPVKCWITIPFRFSLDQGDPEPEVEDSLKTVFQNVKEACEHPYPKKILEIHGHREGLKSFPMPIWKMLNLTYLELSNNEIASIPTNIQGLRELQYLGLSNCQLSRLPDELWKLPKLEKVMVDGNRFLKGTRDSLERFHLAKLFPKDEKGKVIW